MNFADIAVLCVIALIAYICIRYLVNNGLDSCSGECGGCSTCKWARDVEKARRSIEKKKKLKKLLHL